MDTRYRCVEVAMHYQVIYLFAIRDLSPSVPVPDSSSRQNLDTGQPIGFVQHPRLPNVRM